jgi:hypothetical protein
VRPPTVLDGADRLWGRLQGAVIAYQSDKLRYNVCCRTGKSPRSRKW